MFYSHGSIWDTFIKNIFFANFLQIHGSSWDTFIKKFPRKNKKLLCNYKKIIPATTTKSFSFTVFFFYFFIFLLLFFVRVWYEMAQKNISFFEYDDESYLIIDQYLSNSG